MDEASPLLSPRSSEGVETPPALDTALDPDDRGWLSDEDVRAHDHEETKSTWYLILLTISIGG